MTGKSVLLKADIKNEWTKRFFFWSKGLYPLRKWLWKRDLNGHLLIIIENKIKENKNPMGGGGVASIGANWPHIKKLHNAKNITVVRIPFASINH